MIACIKLEKRVVTESFLIRGYGFNLLFFKGEAYYLEPTEHRLYLTKGEEVLYYMLYDMEKQVVKGLRWSEREEFYKLTKRVEE